MSSSKSSSTINVELQRQYFSASLRQLPAAYSSLDTNRLMMVHFACHALHLLGGQEEGEEWRNVNVQERQESAEGHDDRSQHQRQPSLPFPLPASTIIDWIYSLQVESGGFIGGHFLGDDKVHETRRKEEDMEDAETDSTTNAKSSSCATTTNYRQGHIAMTYTAMTLLSLLGDDYSRLNKSSIIQLLQQLQLPDGSFQCVASGGSEHDMRFLYCACCISHMLQDWRGVNVNAALSYIASCRSFDGAIGLLPGQEGHGGSTFCAIASLVLMNRLDDVLSVDHWNHELIRWCVSRQMGGLQGRPNKDEDTCYSYWIGGTLRLLGHDDLLDQEALRNFVLQCQTSMGGFSKVIGVYPDLLHSYYSLAYLSLSQRHLDSLRLQDLNCTLGIGMDTARHFEPLFP